VTDSDTRYRRALPEDTQALHDVFFESIAEVDRRLGSVEAVDPSDPLVRAESWAKWRPIFEHVTATADASWLGEDADGTVLGYARSIRRDDMRELTEFFVRPGAQARGIGGELLRRAFPAEGVRHRTIVATLELAALSRYMRTGLTARCLVLYLSTTPRDLALKTDLEIVPMTSSEPAAVSVDEIDRQLLGHTRRIDHEWLLTAGERAGFVFLREGDPVAYGYVGPRSGPVAALHREDTVAVLSILENRAAAMATPDIAFYVPSLNEEAIAHLLGRGYRMDPFIATFFSDDPNIALDRYLITSPPFFM